MLLVAYKKYILAPIVILANNPLFPKQVVISLREHEAVVQSENYPNR